MDLAMTTINRSTYSLLDLLGDVGGLGDGLFQILDFVLHPIGVLALNSKIVSYVTRFRRRAEPDKNAADDFLPGSADG